MKTSEYTSKYHLFGLDYLRVLFVIFVVMWHEEVGVNPAMKLAVGFPHNTYALFYIFIFYFLMLAVPGFLLISNFLFIFKDGSLTRLKTNMQRFLLILVFWSFVINLFFGNLAFFTGLIPKDLYGLFQLVTGGAFGINFFLVSLCLTQIMTYYIQKISTKIMYVGTVISLVLTLLISILSLFKGNTVIVSWFNPLNFISIPFLAVLMNRVFKNKTNQNRLLWIMLITGIFSAILEWYLLSNKIFLQYGRYGMPDYMRPSIYLISAFLVLLAFKITKPPIKIIRTISYYSLPIYLIHPIYINQAHIFAEKLSINYLQIRNLVASVICIILSIIVAKILTPFLTKITGISKK